jgi:hypothetical protein
MPGPSTGFHGYGYGSWQTPGTYGTGLQRGIASGRAGLFHQGAWFAGAAHALQSPVTNPAGTVTASHPPVHIHAPEPGAYSFAKMAEFPWLKNLGKGGATRSRSRVFQQMQQPQAPAQAALGRGAQPIGAIGYQRGGAALGGRPQPRFVGQAQIRGALPSGPLGLPVGARPMGAAPRPLELPAQAGVMPPGPSRRRRQQVFGQMMFGES